MTKEWAGCVLHNLPFVLQEVHESKNSAKPNQVQEIISYHEMQKSAANWNWYDFME